MRISRKKYQRAFKTYTQTLIKGHGTRDYIEVLTGFGEDLVYRTGLEISWKGSIWDVEMNDDRVGITRSFLDYNGVRHYADEFECIGSGDPYSTVDLILVEASALGLREKVKEMAQTYMLSGIPTEEAYQVAYDYWTEW